MHTNPHTNPILTHDSGVTGRCWQNSWEKWLLVSTRAKYPSSDDKWSSQGRLKLFCFCASPDNSLQTYLVLHQNVRMNLFQRQKRMRWLNSCLQPLGTSTLRRITPAKVSAFAFQSMTPWVCLLAVVFSLWAQMWKKKYIYEVWMGGNAGDGLLGEQSTRCNAIYYSDVSKEQKQWVADCLINCKLTLQ